MGSTLLPAENAIGAVRDLRAQDGKGLLVMGSSTLAAQLVEHDLVDEYRLMISRSCSAAASASSPATAGPARSSWCRPRPPRRGS
jgi:dihydrofolate reductase